MTSAIKKDISNFWCIGINYRNSNAAVRGQYAICPDTYTLALQESRQHGIDEFFIISTCNRTEIYGFATQAKSLARFLCRYTTGSIEHFLSNAYIKAGFEAARHLFYVGAGLDSQILGDYEIIGQIRKAYKQSRAYNAAGSFSERLVNTTAQASKAVKTCTQLSGGSVSVAFAAAQYLKTYIETHHITAPEILLLGIGKIGRNTCKNIIDVVPGAAITLINRTEEKAQQLAQDLQIKAVPFDSLAESIQAADIILVATNAASPIITKEKLQGGGKKLFIDVSIPNNVAPDVAALLGVSLINVDTLSRARDETLKQREAEVPRAKAIIEAHLAEFEEWLKSRAYAPILKTVKHTLRHIEQHPSFTFMPSESATKDKRNKAQLQKVIDGLALKIKTENTIGCHCIQAINNFISAN